MEKLKLFLPGRVAAGDEGAHSGRYGDGLDLSIDDVVKIHRADVHGHVILLRIGLRISKLQVSRSLASLCAVKWWWGWAPDRGPRDRTRCLRSISLK